MATKTLGIGTGANTRNYATLAAYSSYANALALTGPEDVIVYNDGGPVVDTGTVTLNGWTGGSATNTLTVHAAPGQGFRDNANALTNALRYNTANGAAISNTVNYVGNYNIGANVIIDGLMISTAAGSYGVNLGAGSILRNSLLRMSCAGAPVGMSGTGCAMENCVVNAKYAGGTAVSIAAGGVSITDTLIISLNAGGKGIDQHYAQSPAPLIKNTAVYGFATDFTGTGLAGCTNNATDKAVFGGSVYGTAGQVSLTSAEWVSLTVGSEDFTVAAGSTKLKGNGATVGPTVGIRGNARTAPYTIGPDQVGGAAAGATITTTPGNAVASGAPATVLNGVAGTTIATTPSAAVAAGAQASVGTYVQTGVIPNNNGSVAANTAVVWTWTPAGRVGSMVGLTPQDGTGTTDANGRLAPGILLATGQLRIAVRNASAKLDDTFEQFF